MSIGAFQAAPALGWRMDFIHASVLAWLSLLALFALLRVVFIRAGLSDGRAETAQEPPR